MKSFWQIPAASTGVEASLYSFEVLGIIFIFYVSDEIALLFVKSTSFCIYTDIDGTLKCFFGKSGFLVLFKKFFWILEKIAVKKLFTIYDPVILDFDNKK